MAKIKVTAVGYITVNEEELLAAMGEAGTEVRVSLDNNAALWIDDEDIHRKIGWDHPIEFEIEDGEQYEPMIEIE